MVVFNNNKNVYIELLITVLLRHTRHFQLTRSIFLRFSINYGTFASEFREKLDEILSRCYIHSYAYNYSLYLLTLREIVRHFFTNCNACTYQVEGVKYTHSIFLFSIFSYKPNRKFTRSSRPPVEISTS